MVDRLSCTCGRLRAHAGKATLALAVARSLVASAHWENAYWADMAGAVSASEAAFQLLAGACITWFVHQMKTHWNATHPLFTGKPTAPMQCSAMKPLAGFCAAIVESTC